MPTTVSRPELDELRELINEHIETTGESVSSLAERAGLTRETVSRIYNPGYKSSPSIETAAKIAAVIGKKMIWVDS